MILSLVAMNMMAQEKTKVVRGEGVDLHKYKYAYVMPTSGVTSGGLRYDVFLGISGGPTITINPSEKISGYLMKLGYTILPTINPDMADKTMVVAYGNAEGEVSNYHAINNIVVQMRDAQTHALVLSIESSGFGQDEAEAIANALSKAMQMFKYCLNPQVRSEVIQEYRRSVYVNLINETPSIVNQVILKLSYCLNGELMHEQETTITGVINSGEVLYSYIKRDKEARSKKMEIKYEILSYR